MADIVDFVHGTLGITLEPWQAESLREFAAPRGLLSERTRAGLAAAKARGVKLGGDQGYRITEDARRAGAAARQAKADEHALLVWSAAWDILGDESATMRGAAEAMNERGVPTASGTGRWSATQVSRLLRRLEALGKMAGEPAEGETCEGSWLD